MKIYQPPLRDFQFVLHELFEVAKLLKELPAHTEIDRDLINQVIEEGGKFAREVLFPLNHSGDRIGCRYDATTQQVYTPPGFKSAYQEYLAAGWPALACATQYGGQGLPVVLNNVLFEMLNAANQAWTMYPCLTHGAYECLHAHGTTEQQQIYLPKLVSGEWTGTMCLTEAQCGSDLGLLRTKAIAQNDGSYQLTGSKIFISGGEHDLAENIIHLVLARLPEAPVGTKGISLFIVPKFIPNADGSLGARNAIYCSAIESKMGIHGNATCQINLDAASGWLLGQAHKGLQAMFVMMNAARLGVGVQSLGLTETAYQLAVAYAQERLQARSLSGAKQPEQAADAIIVHPDVRRMLLTARAYAQGGRMLASYIALLSDQATHHPNPQTRQDAADLVALLTPVVKAFVTDNAWIAISEALQVFGGHGYIVASGIEQYLRDARINMIYEGTNTIQALDLLGRKVLGDQAGKLKKFAKLVQDFIEQYGVHETMQEFINPLADVSDKVSKLTMELAMKALHSPDEIGAAAVPYLRVIGHLSFAYFFARAAQISLSKLNSGESAFYTAKLATARFYMQRLLPETAMLICQARSGAQNLLALDANLF